MKRSFKSRSRTPAPRRLQVGFPGRSYAFASPSVGLGASCNTVLRTSFLAQATAAANGIWTGYLKTGSCFDPSGSLGATQPSLFDSFAAVYNRYKVNSCRTVIKVTGMSGTNSIVWSGAMYPTIDATALTTYQGAASQPYAKTISGGMQATGTLGLGNAGVTRTFYHTTKAVVGHPADFYAQGALTNADPQTGQYMLLSMFLQSLTAEACTFLLEIDMFQNVTFVERKQVVDV